MKTAIVTGVSRGLGEALAIALLTRGFTVTGIGRLSSGRLTGERYRFVRIDLTNVAGIEAALTPAFRAIADARPASVCLINNAAAVEPVGVVGALDDSKVAAALAVNLIAPFALANLFCRVFTDAALPRRVINVSSGAAERALPGNGAYCVAKAGLEMLTRQLAAEQQAPTFRAISVRPGVIDTGMQAFVRAQSSDVLPSVGLFRGFHESGQLVAPEVVATKIADKLVLGEIEQGRTYNYREL
jgi:benzil reductase ((S)-benzoin forming)